MPDEPCYMPDVSQDWYSMYLCHAGTSALRETPHKGGLGAALLDPATRGGVTRPRFRWEEVNDLAVGETITISTTQGDMPVRAEVHGDLAIHSAWSVFDEEKRRAYRPDRPGFVITHVPTGRQLLPSKQDVPLAWPSLPVARAVVKKLMRFDWPGMKTVEQALSHPDRKRLRKLLMREWDRQTEEIA